jgi:hypothetical protein
VAFSASPARFAAVVLLAAAALAWLILPDPAAAHALPTGRPERGLPVWVFVWGAALVLIVSFVALSILWQSPRLAGDRWRPVRPGLSRLLVNRLTEALAGTVGVFLLGVTIWSGLAGTENPVLNFSVTFVFVTFWLGVVLLSVLLGDVWRALSPWRAIGRAVGATLSVLTRRERPRPLPYPEALGRWPAVIGLVGFLWFELVWGIGGVSPQNVAIASIIYSGFTLTAMGLYGTDAWHERGEAFGSYFRMFSHISPLEVRDGRLGTRRPLTGLHEWSRVRGSVAMVLVAIGGTTFDGAQEGVPVRDWIADLFDVLADTGLDQLTAARTSSSVFMALTLAAMAGIFWLGIAGMRTVDRRSTLGELGARFGYTLIPIALGYLVAHYFSLFVFQEQAQFTYLLSDPLGRGHDYFGTAGGGIDYTLISGTAVWYVQLGSLVLGHVAALVYAHDRALVTYRDPRLATRSQYWMLVVMIAFTTAGLYLVSQLIE